MGQKVLFIISSLFLDNMAQCVILPIESQSKDEELGEEKEEWSPECVICHDSSTDHDEIIRLTCCESSYLHITCFQKFLKTDAIQVCPICRSNINIYTDNIIIPNNVKTHEVLSTCFSKTCTYFSKTCTYLCLICKGLNMAIMPYLCQSLIFFITLYTLGNKIYF